MATPAGRPGRAAVRVVFDLSGPLADALPGRAAQLVRATALRVEAGAKRRCPVRTGTLRRSVRSVFPKPATALVGTDLVYAPYVEYGTRRTPARPFLTPAAEAEVPRFRGDAGDLCDLGGLR